MELWVVAESVVEVSQLPTSETSFPLFLSLPHSEPPFCTASSHRQAYLFVLFVFRNWLNFRTHMLVVRKSRRFSKTSQTHVLEPGCMQPSSRLP